MANTVTIGFFGLYTLTSTYLLSVLPFMRRVPKRSAPWWKKVWYPLTFKYNEIDNLESAASDYEQTLILSQHGILTLALLLLWLVRISGAEPRATHLLGLALFFIADDWLIIANYMRILKGRILPLQSLRLWAANAVVVLLAIWICLDAYGDFHALLLSLGLLAFLSVRVRGVIRGLRCTWCTWKRDRPVPWPDE